jgi:hypothetical protein
VAFNTTALNEALNRPRKSREMRASGVRGLLIYYDDYHCSQRITIDADRPTSFPSRRTIRS